MGLSLGYLWLYHNRATVNIQLGTKASAEFKVYWAESGETYTEKRSSEVYIFPGVKHYSLRIGGLGNVDKLRFQLQGRQKYKIRLISLRIRQKSFQKMVFHKPDHLEQFIPADDIGKSWVDSDGMWVISSGSHPRFDLKLTPLQNLNESKYRYSVFVLFLLLCFFPYQRIRIETFNYVPYLMLIIGTIIFTMASVSRYNKHPDEYVHYQAAKYYEKHYIPPAICAPGTERTYSIYGVSRLQFYEIAHFLSGKFAALLGFLPGDDYRKVRYFNVLLWLILTGVAFKSTQTRLLFVPLLISPQIWYLFSYCNSDAFALFFIFIFSYLIIEPQSILRKYLDGQGLDKQRIATGIMLGILFAILLLLKLNYYFYIIFLIAWGIITIFVTKKRPSNQQVKNTALIAFVATGVIFGRIALDLHANGFDKKAKSLVCQEKLAKKGYKPSTPLHEKPTILKMKACGVTLKAFLNDYKYLPILFRSATTAYGYMQMFAQKEYYRFMLLFLVLFIGVGLFASFYKTPLNFKFLTIALITCTVLIITATAWKSWTSVFQPQGRYIFPVLPMIGIWYHCLKEAIPVKLFNITVGHLFFASIYSFIWIGLLSIPKI